MADLDDLYGGNQNAPVADVSSTASSVGFENFLASVSSFVYDLNGWFLAFTIFYSFWFFCDFIFKRVLYSDGQIEAEEEGMEALTNFFKMWAGYVVFLFFWLITIFNQGYLKNIFEFLALISAFVAIVVVDFTIIPVIKNIIGFPGLTVQSFFSHAFGLFWAVVKEFWDIFAGYFYTAPKSETKK
jgi:hypothetical protein